jgi:enterochelin esterase-like enzyme
LHKIKFYLFSLILILILSSCTPEPPYTPLSSDCTTPGSVTHAIIEETSRGYPYRYALYLPPCYEAKAAGYPVIYLIPGRGGGPGDWFAAGAGEIAGGLIFAGEIPPFIIVSTESTNNDAYADAIYSDLIPHIEAEYNAIPDRELRAVAGGSLGGIAAYRLNLQYPADFASTGMFGSGVINGEQGKVENWLAEIQPALRPRFFLNSGESDPLMLAQAREMITVLEKFELEYHLEVGEGGHTYTYWASNLADYFRWVAKNW